MIAERRHKDLSINRTIFDGELSESDSDSSSHPPGTVISHGSSVRKRDRKVKPATPRPQRKHVIKSYAESDTDNEDLVPRNSAGGKRRRESSIESPSKRAKIAPGKTPRKRTFSTGHLPHSRRSAHLSVGPLPRSQPTHIDDTNSRPLILRTKKQVFIKLNARGSPSLEQENIYWWPAKTLLVDPDQATCRLYGDDGHGISRLATVNAPSSRNVKAMWYTESTPRYTKESFQKGMDIEKTSFQSAMKLAINDTDIDEGDEMIIPVEDGGEESPPPSDHSHQSNAMDTRRDEESRPSTPEGYRDCVNQPVLCKSSPNSATYWPAKVVEYIPPAKHSEKPRFKIDFFDWKTAKLTRDCFFTKYDEDEIKFADCELDRKKLQDWITKNSYLPEDDEEPFEFDFSTLPLPSNPIPKPRVFIDQISIETQFAYVIPFMERVLREEYPPSQGRIDQWMLGGAHRQAITLNPIQGGNLAELEWNVFGKLVNAWALPEKSHSAVNGEQTIENPAHPRPRGSERYEALDSKDRNLFVIDVLIGEAVIQLLLLRYGKRTQLNVLDDENEELELYKAGELLSNEQSTSILVRTILDERSSARARLRMKPESSLNGADTGEAVADEGGRRQRTRLRNGK